VRTEDETREILFGIKPGALVTVTKMNHIVEIQHMKKMNLKPSIKKLSKDKYLVIESGEIKDFEHIENRSQSFNSIRQTLKKMRYLIDYNFDGRKNELFCTLTYAENMTDVGRLYTDFKRFMTRLKRRYKDKGSIDYINVVEPQERGAWHCHLLLRFNDVRSIFLENSEIAEMWGQGFVTIRSLTGVDNIGAYLSAYLADIELTDGNMSVAMQAGLEVVEKEVQGVKKRFIKGGRLHLYPSGMNFYRKSKGILYPEREIMTYKNAKKIVGSAQPHYKKTTSIQRDDFENTITYEQYNLKRM